MMDDLISRQAAIDAMRQYAHYDDFDVSVVEEDIAVIALKDLPSVPERKKGRWIVRDNPGTGWYRVTCSECGEDVTSTIPMIGFFPDAKPLWDYCPDCGASMTEGAEE